MISKCLYQGWQYDIDYHTSIECLSDISQNLEVMKSSLIGKFNMNTMKTCLRSLQWYVVDFTSSQQVHPCREYRSISGGQWNSTCAAGNKSVALSDIWGQLTLARLRGAIALRCFHKTSLAHFDRYVTATSDWHASLCPVTVSLYTIFNYAY